GKEVNGWIGDCLLWRKAGGDGWNAQWAQSLYALALGAQRFATGRQDVDARRASEHLFCQGGGRIDDMLAAIEYEQHLLVAKQCNQSRNRTRSGLPIRARKRARSARARGRSGARDRRNGRRRNRTQLICPLLQERRSFCRFRRVRPA